MELRSHTPKGNAARGKILRAAERLFGERGFHGASMRDVAALASVPLANVVYHFTTKERLYADVLESIAAPLTRGLAGALAGGDAAASAGAARSFPARLDAVVLAFLRWAADEPGQVKLLLRELLDNPGRVDKASKLPLSPVLEGFASFVRDGIRAGAFADVVPETAILHFVGALSYVVAAKPTVKRIVGAERERRLAKAYQREALTFARHVFGVGPASAAKRTSTPSRTSTRRSTAT